MFNALIEIDENLVLNCYDIETIIKLFNLYKDRFQKILNNRLTLGKLSDIHKINNFMDNIYTLKDFIIVYDKKYSSKSLRTNNYETCALIAAKYGNLPMLMSLPPVLIVNQRIPIIFEAIQTNQLSIIQELFKRCPSIKFNKHIIHHIAVSGYLDTITFLINSQDNPHNLSFACNLLTIFAGMGYAKLITLPFNIVENLPQNDIDEAAISFAARKCEDAVNFLLTKGAKCGPIFLEAAGNGWFNIVNMILNRVTIEEIKLAQLKASYHRDPAMYKYLTAYIDEPK